MGMEATNVSRVLTIVMIVLLASVTVAAIPVSANPRVIRVPRDYSTIQEAVDFASSGDMIIVGPGEYYGAILDKENVEIRGLGAVIVDGPQIDGDPTIKMGFFCESLLASGVTISGFTFMVDLPVLGRVVNDVIVEHNVMIEPIQGVTCVCGNGWTIGFNDIRGIDVSTTYEGLGIYIVSTPLFTPNPIASNNLVAFNKITGYFPDPRPYPPIGILLHSIEGGVVTDNKVVHNQIVMTGSDLDLWPIPPIAIGMLCPDPDVENKFFHNKIGFNDLRGSALEVFGYPWSQPFWDYNDISRNLGTNRAYDGMPPNEFKPLI